MAWTERLVAHVAQLVEHVLGKDEVTSSSLVVGSSLGRLGGWEGLNDWGGGKWMRESLIG